MRLTKYTIFLAGIYLAAVMIATSCSTVPTTPSTPSVTPSPVPQTPPWPVKGWQYDTIAQRFISSTMLYAHPGDLCPNYLQVSYQKFWLNLVKGIAKAESGWDRTNQYVETAMGIDPITGVQVKSEGLLQLSYQDTKSYPDASMCQLMSWPGDKGKELKDRSIMQPEVNIGCGMQIMDQLLKKNPGDVVKALGKYWSTIRIGREEARNFLKDNVKECYL